MMLLYPPKHFDGNEWFIIIMILLSLLLFKLPKKIPTSLTVLICLLSVAIPTVIDNCIAAVPPYNLYQVTDTQKYELFDFLMYFTYPPFGYLCIYLHELWHIQGIRTLFYIIGWTAVAMITELLYVYFNVIQYTGWHVIYSLPIYIFVLSFFIVFYIFIKDYHEKTMNHTSIQR